MSCRYCLEKNTHIRLNKNLQLILKDTAGGKKQKSVLDDKNNKHNSLMLIWDILEQYYRGS
jgi:hypothetical protein